MRQMVCMSSSSPSPLLLRPLSLSSSSFLTSEDKDPAEREAVLGSNKLSPRDVMHT